MMSDNDPFDWGTLEDHVTPEGDFAPPARVRTGTGPDAKTVRFPCQACHGSGRWAGGVNNYGSGHCFACGGKGYFLTSERDRAKARQGAHERKAKRRAEDRAAFDAANEGVTEFLQAASGWSQFARDVLAKLQQYGSLTEGTLRAVRNMQAKCEARRAERSAERSQQQRAAVEADLSAVRAMFERAVQGGLRRPIYRAEGLVISRAPDTGKNPGALYVKTAKARDGGAGGDEYLGKVIGTAYLGKPEAAAALAAIAADPRGAAIAYGRATGSCACCGRELTDPASIELGIGPICQDKWGL